MTDWCIKLKNKLEETFSMPFEVSLSVVDGEEQYTCYPTNSEEMFFTVKAFIHNQIRLVVEIAPQKFAGAILTDMAYANHSQRKIFFQYIDLLNSEKAKVSFAVNNELVSSEKIWPKNWHYFKSRIDLVPIPEIGGDDELFTLLSNWAIHGISLVLSLLTLEDNTSYTNLSPEKEGEAKEIRSIRYERSRANREICLAHKGYSCYACGFNFLERYGLLGKDYIEVHHTTPVSEMGDDYEFDIDRDLVPVCSNCHSMLHRKKPPYTIDELQDVIARNGGIIDSRSEKVKVIQIYPEYQPDCIPLYSLRAACGAFVEGETPEEEGWVDATGHGFTPDPKRFFVVRAKGKSMEPRIKDGSFCVFEKYNGGSREGEIVLTEIKGTDSDYDCGFTIKKYHSEKIKTDEGWEHSTIILQSLNPDCPNIELEEGERYRTFGTLKCVLS